MCLRSSRPSGTSRPPRPGGCASACGRSWNGPVAMEYRIDNSCDRIGPVLGPQQDVTEHMQALPHREVAAVIRTVRASPALPAARLAFEFLVLTAARWGRGAVAEWEEIDRGREGVDRPREAGEDEPPAPGAAVWPCPGDSRRGTDTR